MARADAGSAMCPLALRRWAASGLVLLVLFAGCAGMPMGAGTGVEVRQDVVTESDEPEARRRARVRMALAVGYFEQGQTTVALDELKQSLAIDPSYGDAHNLRGLIYMRMNDLRVAEGGFKQAIALNPSDGNARHNLGWLYCQQNRHAEAVGQFGAALALPLYAERAKTWMVLGLCQRRAGQIQEAERSLARAYELDAGNPIVGYNLSLTLFERGELERARFYVRRINNSEYANAETLWLGIKVERRLSDPVSMSQLADQLRRRFPQSSQWTAYERGAFDEQ